MSSTDDPGWLAMKYGTTYCSLPARSEAARNFAANVSNAAWLGFFISDSTRSDVCSGATFRCPPTWCFTCSSTYSSSRFARSMRMPDDLQTPRHEPEADDRPD